MPEGAKGEKGRPKTYRERAESELRDVRRLLKKDGVPEDQQVALKLQQANVLATLDLAEAIRGHANSDG
jgi:hypothetical protein